MGPLVIFDCDGVLVDSEVIYLDLELDHLARAGMAIERDTYVRTYSGLPPNEWEARVRLEFADRMGRPIEDRVFTALREEARVRFAAGLRPVPGARDGLAGLAHAKCVASSSATAELHWKLRHTGLHALFDPYIFSSELVARGKPEPDLFLHAAAVMWYAPEMAIVVEDSANGVRAGRAAGMTVIGFAGGGHCSGDHGAMLRAHGADTVVDSFDELADAIAAFADLPPVAAH